MTGRIKAVAYSIIAAIAALLLAFAPSANAANMIDVSSWQTGINVTTSGAQIVAVKATEGIGYVNPDCNRVVQDALSAGQGVGVYHFAQTENDPRREAQYFIDHTREYVGKGIVPILDWEPSAPWDTSWALTWLRTVESAWGTKPIIYTYQYAENTYNWSNVVAGNYGLWIAAYKRGNSPIYGFNPPNKQPTLRHWPFAVAWQYTGNGHLKNWRGPLDLSVVYGDLSTWYAYAGSRPTNSSKPKPKPQPKPQPSAPAANCVVIQKGQYVSMFWEDWWNVTVPGGNPSIVYPGDRACHRGNRTPAAHHTYRTYVVRSGDTLSGIAARLGISIYSIKGYRSGNPNIIYPGEVLHY